MPNQERSQTTWRQIVVTLSEATISMKSKQTHAGARVPNGHPEQVGKKRAGKARRGSEPLRERMSERAQLRPEEAEKADAETVTKIIPWALLVQWGHI